VRGNDDEERRTTAGIDVEQMGRVTYAGARVDVPVSRAFSLIPQAELLNVMPRATHDRDILRPYFGGGIGLHPIEAWDFEGSLLYGPPAYGTTALEGVFGISKEFGADWEHDVSPPVEASMELAGTHIQWSDGGGPAGSDIWQAMIAAEALIHLGRWQLTPKGMFFLYDRTLAFARGVAEGLLVLARVGTFAPQGLGGARFGYEVGRLVPFVESDEIVYAAGIGDATRLVGGGKLKLGRGSSITVGAGALWNRVGGPLAPRDEPALLPVALAQADIEF
jgi:hypothetical protein